MIPFLDAARVRALGYAAAVGAIESALRAGLDPAADPPRTITALGGQDELFSMPSAGEHGVGIKLVTRTPRNAAAGLPLVHAVYVLFDPDTLAPAALLDGAALTTLRTPAVSVAAVRPTLARFAERPRVVVFGTGPQGIGHLEALCELEGVPRPAEVTFVVRGDTRRAVRIPEGVASNGVLAGTDDLDSTLARAHIVVCATTAREPLFDSALLGDAAVVIAVGSHEPDAREVDAAFCARADVIVEDADTALRESGEVVQAIAEGALSPTELRSMRDVVTGKHQPADRPVLFTGSGMAWEDLVVASAVVADRRT